MIHLLQANVLLRVCTEVGSGAVFVFQSHKCGHQGLQTMVGLHASTGMLPQTTYGLLPQTKYMFKQNILSVLLQTAQPVPLIGVMKAMPYVIR